jgi:hypothetical protein
MDGDVWLSVGRMEAWRVRPVTAEGEVRKLGRERLRGRAKRERLRGRD